MEKGKALELLDLDTSATALEIRSAYVEMSDELQKRITNAPTDHQRKLYDRRLKELEKAYEVIGHSSAEDTDELPNIIPVEVKLPKEDNEVNRSEKLDPGALGLLGLQRPFTVALLENAYRKKKRELEAARLESPIDSIKAFYTTEIRKLEQAYIYLKPLADKTSKDDNAKFKRTGVKNWVFLALAAGVIGAGSFFWLSLDQPPELDPEQREQFVSLKSQGDLLAGRMEWTEALEKYRSAAGIQENQEVQDSIASIESKLLSIEREKTERARQAEEEAWKETTELNTLTAYEAYLAAYPEGMYAETANKEKGVLNSKALAIEKEKVEKARLSEEKAWEKTTEGNTLAAYESYLVNYPGGKYVQTAQKKIAAYKEAERVKNMVVTKELFGLVDNDDDEFNYIGQTKADLPHGRGVANYIKGDIYTGDWHNGSKHGQGTYIWEKGGKYVGQWKDDDIHGSGTYSYSNGAEYVGEWREKVPNGRGIFTWKDGARYVGEFKNGKFHGKGEAYDSEGSLVYKGEWINGDAQQ